MRMECHARSIQECGMHRCPDGRHQMLPMGMENDQFLCQSMLESNRCPLLRKRVSLLLLRQQQKVSGLGATQKDCPLLSLLKSSARQWQMFLLAFFVSVVCWFCMAYLCLFLQSY